jgi:hypothetical protein
MLYRRRYGVRLDRDVHGAADIFSWFATSVNRRLSGAGAAMIN